MNKTIQIILALLLAVVISLGIVIGAVLMMPEQFDEIYFGELADKYERLRLAGENKIVIIGGSSVAFGVNTQMMEEYLDRPVVNFGLYGPLGTTIMMDLTKGNLSEGDIVILAPESDEQTMSMTFNGEGFWECCDSDFTMLLKVPLSKWGEMLGSFWTYAEKKLNFYRYGKAESNDVYSHSSFNERGDLVFNRDYVRMDDWYDAEVLIDLNTEIIEDEFIDYVNDYVAYCERIGVTVYWSYPPMNILAVQQDYEERLEYASYLREHLDCQIISNLDDYILWPGYFYDTNYHVNTRGVSVHTANLTQDIMNKIGDGEKVDIELDAPLTRENPTSLEPAYNPSDEPDPTDVEVIDEETDTEIDQDTEPVSSKKGSSKDAQYFLTEEFGDGLRTVGITEEGKQRKELEVPWEIDGKTVYAVGSNTFAGCDKLTTIYIQANIDTIESEAFDGCSALQAIRIDNDGGNVLVPGKDLFNNVAPRAKVQVSRENYGSFIADYFWGNYTDRIEMYNG